MKLDHPDLLALLNALLDVTKKLLEKQGAFLPHGAFLTPEGKVSLLDAKTGEEKPGAKKVLQVLEYLQAWFASYAESKFFVKK